MNPSSPRTSYQTAAEFEIALANLTAEHARKETEAIRQLTHQFLQQTKATAAKGSK